MIKQFLSDVCWEQLDYLVIDTPPGTSDEHISIVETLKQGFEVDGAVLVTTPQAVAVADVRREITFCRKGSLPILGLIENMSGYTCPHCQVRKKDDNGWVSIRYSIYRYILKSLFITDCQPLRMLCYA